MDLWADLAGRLCRRRSRGGGDAVYYFHYLPLEMGAVHYAPGTFNFFSATRT